MALPAILAALEPSRRMRLSRLCIERVDLGWQVRLHYAGMVPAPPEAVRYTDAHAITVETTDLPPGVRVVGWISDDTVHPLPDETPAQIARWVAILEADNALGRLNIGRTSGGGWLLVTHAGSDDERRAWVRRLHLARTSRLLD